MSALKNLIGQRFGYLVVAQQAASDKAGKARWLCKCDCGGTTPVTSTNLKTGHVKSCGCYNRQLVNDRNFKHGHAPRGRPSAEYVCWRHVRNRCFDPLDPSWKYYGGRGITMCDQWKDDFTAFIRDMGQRPSPKHSIDRKNNDGNYEPGNCRWATAKEQRNNRRPQAPCPRGEDGRFMKGAA